jgi:cysteine desulfurase
MQRIYLDYNASAPLLPEARAEMIAMLDVAGNASSVHRDGQAQKRAVENARRAVAALAGAKPDNVVFTSGASEAAALLLSPAWTLGRAPLLFGRLLCGATEHPCVASGGRFAAADVERLPVGGDGRIRGEALLPALEACTASGNRPLVAIQLANNETGVIQDISALAQVIHGAGGFLICDAAQAAGRISIDIAALGADALILSAHKMGGPKGAGAVVFGGEIMRPAPMISGGGQEKGFRAGTENAPAIAGFGAAARLAREGLGARAAVAALRDGFEEALAALAPGITIHGKGAPRLDNTSFFSVPGLKAETVMIGLDLAGVSVSSGSACSSGKVGRSAVLEAMGWTGDIAGGAGAIRVSFGPQNRPEDVEKLLSSLRAQIARRAAQG